MRRFLAVIEQAEGHFPAYSPDLPGRVATGAPRDEAKGRMREAMAMHIAGLQEDGLAVPEPNASVEYVDVAS